MADRRGGTIKWRLRGFEEVRRMPEVARLLNDEVAEILTKVTEGGFTDDDYAGGVEHGASRLRGFVVTTSHAAIRREADEHALLKALGGGS